MVSDNEEEQVVVTRWPELSGHVEPGKVTYPFMRISRDDPMFDVSSSSSVLSDQFKEVNQDIFIPKGRQRRDSKLAADFLLMSEFSEDYKNNMFAVRTEMGIGESMMAEDPEFIRSNAKIYEPITPNSKEIINLAHEMLKDVEVESIPTKDVDEDDARKNLPFPKAESVPDNRSGLWRMLDSHEKFTIAPPGYNEQTNQKHWLEQKEIPLQIREEAREKCLHWLKNQQKQ